MIDVEREHSFPVAVSDAFAYITNTQNWPEYWPDFVRIEDAEHASWAAPGDNLTVVIKLLGREVPLELTLEELQQDSVVRYTSRQRGLPDARHERRFTATPAGFDYTLSVSFDPRGGPRGIVDRIVVKRAIASALRTTIANLERVFEQRRRA
jgi:hypothetical protein